MVGKVRRAAEQFRPAVAFLAFHKGTCVHRTTFNWPESVDEAVRLRGAFQTKPKMWRCAMGIALEVNFALWIMIGCGIAEYLS